MGLLEGAINQANSDSFWTIATAVGTVGAVFVTLSVLFVRSINSWWKRPRVGLSSETIAGFNLISAATRGGRRVNYLQLIVENEGLGRPAEDVQVFLVAAFRDGKRVHLNPMPLGWSNIGDEPQILPTGIVRTVDLFSVWGPDPNGPHDSHGEIEVAWKPADCRQFTKAGQHVMFLILTGSNFKSKRFSVVVSFDGKFIVGKDQWESLKLISLAEIKSNGEWQSAVKSVGKQLQERISIRRGLAQLGCFGIDKGDNPADDAAMLTEQKAAALYWPCKKKIERMGKGDTVFQYRSGSGIDAHGKATGNVDRMSYQGKPEEKLSQRLVDFQLVDPPMSASEIKATAEQNILFRQTVIWLDFETGQKLEAELRERA